MDNFHGNVIFTCGLMTTPFPICAPNRRKTHRLNGEIPNGHKRKSKRLTTSQRASFNLEAPRLNWGFENAERSTGTKPKQKAQEQNGKLWLISVLFNAGQYTPVSVRALEPSYTHQAFFDRLYPMSNFAQPTFDPEVPFHVAAYQIEI